MVLMDLVIYLCCNPTETFFLSLNTIDFRNEQVQVRVSNGRV